VVSALLTAVFDGPDSYWWGDEQNYCHFWKESFGSMTRLQNYGTLDFTFKNGAEWFYFGDDCYYELSVWIWNFTAPVARAKYVSAITLEDGGIVNLQDADIQQKLASVPGLLTVYPKLKEINHDFVTIGDLKGSGGIFKLDLNTTDKSQSDMIYIESSSSPGQHYIESTLTEDDLAALSSENTLRFATTAAAASGVSFSYLLPQYDDSLYLYTPLVGSSTYVSGDAENEIYNARYGGSGNYGDSEGSSVFTNLLPSLDQTYENGLNWFLYGCEIKVDPVVPRLAGTAVGTYDFALDMDRLDKRQGQAQYLSGKDDGFWVRFNRGSNERSSKAKGTYTMGQFGYDRLLGSHRVGIAMDYKKGSSRIDDSMAFSENKRRAAMIYDTWTFRGGAYLDLTARYGKLDSDVRAFRDDGRELTGSYDSHTAAVGIEFGIPFRWGDGWFFEPQAQFQYAWLSAESYRTSNGYEVALDRAESAMGRLGFRFGTEFGAKNTAYIKADVMHEFSGGQNMTLSGRGRSLSYAVEKRGTWYDVGFGADWQIGRNASMFVDVEKVFGDDVKGWELNAGLSITW
jgi:outer membrane autotransporter protein